MEQTRKKFGYLYTLGQVTADNDPIYCLLKRIEDAGYVPDVQTLDVATTEDFGVQRVQYRMWGDRRDDSGTD